MLRTDTLPITSSTVTIRPLATRDAAAYAAGSQDAAVRQFAHLPEPEYTTDSVRAMVSDAVEPGIARGDLAILAIADAVTDEFAGSLVVFDVRPEQAEVGFWLHPAHRGRGFALAALAAATDFAQKSGLTRLLAATTVTNAASQRTLEAAGFARGETEFDTTPSGETVELVHYALEVRPDPSPA